MVVVGGSIGWDDYNEGDKPHTIIIIHTLFFEVVTINIQSLTSKTAKSGWVVVAV